MGDLAEKYDAKCKEFASLQAEFDQFQETAQQYEAELEANLKITTEQQDSLTKQLMRTRAMLEELKEQDRSEEEGKAKALEMLKSKFAELAEEVKKLKTTQRQLEQDKDDLERKLRIETARSENLQNSLDNALEEGVMMQQELQELSESTKETIARLKEELRDERSNKLAANISAQDAQAGGKARSATTDKDPHLQEITRLQQELKEAREMQKSNDTVGNEMGSMIQKLQEAVLERDMQIAALTRQLEGKQTTQETRGTRSATVSVDVCKGANLMVPQKPGLLFTAMSLRRPVRLSQPASPFLTAAALPSQSAPSSAPSSARGPPSPTGAPSGSISIQLPPRDSIIGQPGVNTLPTGSAEDKQLRQLVKPFTLLALQNEAIKQTREQELAKEEEEQKRRQQEKEKEMEKIKKEAEEEARKKAEKAAAELLKADQEAKAFKAAAIAKQKEAMREIDKLVTSIPAPSASRIPKKPTRNNANQTKSGKSPSPQKEGRSGIRAPKTRKEVE